jgi:hypothetical protein
VPPGGDSRANRAVTGAASAARGPADERESPHSMTITRAAPSAVQTRCIRVAASRSLRGRPRHSRPRCSPGFAIDHAKPASADLVRHDPHEPLLRCSMPRKQRQVGSVEQFVASRDLLPAALHHDAPGLALVGVVPVRLESDVAFDRASELRALSCPEDDGAVVHDIVDRKDLRSVGDQYCQPPGLLRPQQRPTHVHLEVRHPEAELVGRHGRRVGGCDRGR